MGIGACPCGCDGEPSPDCPECCSVTAPFLDDDVIPGDMRASAILLNITANPDGWSGGSPNAFYSQFLGSQILGYSAAASNWDGSSTPVGMWGDIVAATHSYLSAPDGIGYGVWETSFEIRSPVPSGPFYTVVVRLVMYCGRSDVPPWLIYYSPELGSSNIAGIWLRWDVDSEDWVEVPSSLPSILWFTNFSMFASGSMPDECCDCCQELTADTILEASDDKHYLVLDYSPAGDGPCADLAGQYLLLRSGDTYSRDGGDGITAEATLGDANGDPNEVLYSSCLYTVTGQSRWISSISITNGSVTFSVSGGGSGEICKSSSDSCGCVIPSVSGSAASVWLQPEGSLAESVTVTFLINVVTEMGPSTWEGSGDLPLFSAGVVDGYVTGAGYSNTLLTQIPLSKTSGDSPYVGLAFVGAVGTGSSQGSRFVVAGVVGDMSFEGYGSPNATSGSVPICPQSFGVRYVSGGTVIVG